MKSPLNFLLNIWSQQQTVTNTTLYPLSDGGLGIASSEGKSEGQEQAFAHLTPQLWTGALELWPLAL